MRESDPVLTAEDLRVAVVGPTGSGKTTLAKSLAQKLGTAHVDLDSLFWESNWKPGKHEVVRRRIVEALSSDRWVSDGNYGKFADVQLSRTTTLVWLDYSLSVCLLRLLRRTIIRSITRSELWAGNRESFTRQFLSKRSIFLFLLRQHGQLRRHYLQMIQVEAGHLKVIRLSSPSKARSLMRGCAVRSTWAM